MRVKIEVCDIYNEMRLTYDVAYEDWLRQKTKIVDELPHKMSGYNKALIASISTRGVSKEKTKSITARPSYRSRL